MKKENMKPVPVVGQEYHFFDDGKLSYSRHSIAKCTRVITPEEAKGIIFNLVDYDNWNPDTKEWEEEIPYQIPLYDRWEEEVLEHHNNPESGCRVFPCNKDGYWLYAPETDYFVECSIPGYDDNEIWFVRTIDGGWFSFDIQSSWQSGRLDVDSSLYNNLVEMYGPEQ